MDQRAREWQDLPLLLGVAELRAGLGLTREQSYRLAHCLGIRLGRRLVIPKGKLRQFFDAPDGTRGEGGGLA